MRDWLPLLAALGITVPFSCYMKLPCIMAGFLSGGVYALIVYFGG